jgi:amidase
LDPARGCCTKVSVAELYANTATELATLIRGGEVSCREVVEAHLARIDAVNGRVNAVTVALSDTALAAADRADEVRRSGGAMAPLHGVPFTVKENIDCLGTATTHGVRALRDAMPYMDAPVVARMKAAGAILIGRTNLSEMGLRLCSDNPLRGRTRNPWNPRVTAGGSSGGDAVAVATGMTPIGIGNDIGGSLRVPAHCCGVATLKPTTGRIAHAASLPPQDYGMSGQAMLAPGPIARSVADLRLCLSLLSGRDVRDPRSVDVPLKGPPPEERRAALVTEIPGARIPSDTLAAVRRAGEILTAAGWAIEEVAPPEVLRVGELWQKLVATDLSVVMPMVQPVVTPELFEHVMRLCRGAKLHEVSNNRMHEERSRLMRAWSGFFAEYPVAVGPSLIGAPWPLDADLNPNTGPDLLAEATRFILPANALGLPAVALPMGVSNGLPTGVQVYADLWREDLCLEVAEIIEQGVRMELPIDPVT